MTRIPTHHHRAPDHRCTGSAPRTWALRAFALVAVVGLLTACMSTSAPEGLEQPSERATPTSGTAEPTAADVPSGDEVTVEQVVDLAGTPVPDGVEDTTATMVPGTDVDLLRLDYTIPAGEADAVCAAAGLQDSLPRLEPFTDDEIDTFGLADDAAPDGARSCEGMRGGTNVSREILFVPAGDDRLEVHVVAFEMPR